MKAIVKIVWSEKPPRLKLASEDGYEYIELEKGLELRREVIDKRRCVGYHDSRGSMTSCPEFREIGSGDQCSECRRKDIYTGWRTGDSSPDTKSNADYSLYLAQCGDSVKVGVARSSRLETRWLEQGADYATEIDESLTPDEALKREKKISGEGISERIRKDRKLEEADPALLKQRLEGLGYGDRRMENISEGLEASEIKRSGRFPRPVKHVKGQIVSNGTVAMALTSGKVLAGERQKGLGDY